MSKNPYPITVTPPGSSESTLTVTLISVESPGSSVTELGLKLMSESLLEVPGSIEFLSGSLE